MSKMSGTSKWRHRNGRAFRGRVGWESRRSALFLTEWPDGTLRRIHMHRDCQYQIWVCGDRLIAFSPDTERLGGVALRKILSFNEEVRAQRHFSTQSVPCVFARTFQLCLCFLLLPPSVQGAACVFGTSRVNFFFLRKKTFLFTSHVDMVVAVGRVALWHTVSTAS